MADHVGTAGPIPLEQREPRDFVEAQLTDICEDLLGVGRIEPHLDLFEQGADSFAAAKIVSRINRFFRIRLQLSTFATASTIGDLAEHVRARPGSAVTQRLVRVAGPMDGPPFFCVHAQSGEVFFLRTLRTRSLSPAIWGIRSPGLDGEEPPLSTVDEMADRYVEEIRGVQASGPYRLGGLCMGGAIAFEMARRLVAQGESVAGLALLDTSLFPGGKVLAPDQEILDPERIMREMAESDAALPTRPGGRDGQADDSGDYWSGIVRRLKEQARIPRDMDVDLYRRRLMVTASNSVAIARHVVRPARLGVSVTLFASRDLYEEAGTPQANWLRVALDGVELVDVDTGHFDLLYSDELPTRLNSMTKTRRPMP